MTTDSPQLPFTVEKQVHFKEGDMFILRGDWSYETLTALQEKMKEVFGDLAKRKFLFVVLPPEGDFDVLSKKGLLVHLGIDCACIDD